MRLLIYGASDDLVEVDGDFRDEFDALGGPVRLRLTAPDGEGLDVLVGFCVADDAGPGPGLDWTIHVVARDSYPSWPVLFVERPDYEGDPAVQIDAPEGTTVRQVVAQ